VLQPIKCKKCNQNMRWQISELEAILHCEPCKRAVVVSDWKGNPKFLSK